MFELTIQEWNDLVNKVGSIADKTERQLVHMQGYLNELNGILNTTNIILSIIALALVALVIIEWLKYKKK